MELLVDEQLQRDLVKVADIHPVVEDSGDSRPDVQGAQHVEKRLKL